MLPRLRVVLACALAGTTETVTTPTNQYCF